MQTVADRPEAPTAIRTDLGAIFVSLELSRSTWLITSLSPGGGEKMSKQVVRGGDVAGLLERFARLREKARARTGKVFPFVVIQEAGLDGFWIDRALQNEGIESHVVDPASIATSRRRRRAKTDGIDGEALVRALLAYKRGEPRVCAMVKAPTPEEEDRRRLCRERKVLIGERVQHVNRVKGLLFSQGISGYEPLRRDRRRRLDTLQTGDGRLLPVHLKAQVCRELDRLELLLEQIKAVEAERDVLLAAQHGTSDVLKFFLAEIDEPFLQAVTHLPVGVLGETDGAGFGDAFQSRGNVDAVAHQVAVALLDHIAEVDADPELDAALRGKTGIALDHTVLHLDGAAHGIDDASELDEDAVAGALHCAAMMRGDGGIEQIAPQPAQPSQCPVLVGTGEPAVSDYIRRKDGCEFPSLRHGSPSQEERLAQLIIQNWLL